MFHTVRLQASDSPKSLAALGLKLKRKRGGHVLLQPCPAFRGTHCAIYAERPERCRLFECRQLQRIATGETTEMLALEKIRSVQRRVEQLQALLETSGATNAKHALSRRCEAALAAPRDAATDPRGTQLQHKIAAAMRELDAMLDADFRIKR